MAYTNKNIKTDLDTIKKVGQQLIDQKIKPNFARQDGYYAKMTVGSAENLVGQKGEGASFFERPTGGSVELANGVAQLDSVAGKSVKWNQLVKNGNFADGTTGWSGFNGSISASDGILEYTVTTAIGGYAQYAGRMKTEPNIENHKYYFIYKVKCDKNAAFYSGGVISPAGAFTYTGNGSWQRFCKIFNSVETKTNGNLYVSLSKYSDNSPIEVGDKFYLRNVVRIDLTAMFGSDANIAAALGITTAEITTDAGVAAFEKWLEENIGKQPYYPYNAGEVLNVKMTGLESTGYNLLKPADGSTPAKARIIGEYDSKAHNAKYGIIGQHGTLTFISDSGEETVLTNLDTETVEGVTAEVFDSEESGYLVVADAAADCTVFFWWDGTEVRTEAYKTDVAKLDVTHIYGKLNGTGELVQVFPYGMCGLNDVKDSLSIVDGVVMAKKAYTHLDMGATNWIYRGEGNTTLYYSTTVKNRGNILCPKYQDVSGSIADPGIYAVTGVIRVLDSSYTDAATFRAAMTGVILHYELATPQLYTNLVYQGSELYPDGTPVVLPVNYEADNWGIERVLPINDESAVGTAMPEIRCIYSIDALETLDTHGTQIDDLYEGALDGRYAKKRGVEDELVVGAAKAIAGNHRQVKEFTSMVIDGANGIAKINEGMGKSLVWNQMVRYGFDSHTVSGITFSFDVTTQTIRMNGTATASYAGSQFVINSNLIVGHKYIFKYVVVAGQMDGTMKIGLLNQNSVSSTSNSFSIVFTANGVGKNFGLAELTANTAYDVTVKTILIDLTLMFGAGNEPATVEEFEKLFPNAYYPYNAGEIISNKTEKLGVTGFNQWDEEWEVGGLNSTGGEMSNNSRFRSKNYIKVLPNTDYYCYSGVAIGRTCCYDINHEFIELVSIVNRVFRTPEHCAYIRFSTNDLSVPTYNHDICINISDADRNGTYEAYKHNDIVLNLAEITGKAAGSEESVVIFPDGMRSAGSVYDSLVVDEDGYARKAIVRMQKVDLGTLVYTKTNTATEGHYRFVSTGIDSLVKRVSNSAEYANILCSKYQARNGNEVYTLQNGIAILTYGLISIYDDSKESLTVEQFKAAMDGVYLSFELTTPIEYTLDTPILMTFMAYKGGTIIQSPQAPLSAPMKMNVTFALDAVGTLNGLPEDYISAASMDAFLTQLGTAMGGTWSKSYNESLGRWEFHFESSQS